MRELRNSSPGWDDLPAMTFKPVLEHFSKPLTFIINQSIREGIFPDCLKIAKIVPIYKTGDKSLISNYRPISVLTFFSKVFEKIMYNYVLDFINTHNILYKFQFGFRKQHSTSHAIITLVERINTVLNAGNIMVGVFLDLRRAFDTVDHDILVKKLYAYGIRGNILAWFKSYLYKRQQYVYMNKTKSSIQDIICGIPQGSVLGPLLFILYINDLSKASDHLFSILFADDTSIFMEGDTLEQIIYSLNKELDKLSIWLAANKLTLNVLKSYYMIFHRARLKHKDCKVALNNTSLQHVKFTKFLGIIIDDKLSFINHISYIKAKISKGIGILIKTRKYLNKEKRVDLFNTFILPYMTYCLEVWGNAYDSHLEPIIKLQRKAIRIITFSRYTVDADPLFWELNILPLKKLVIQRIGLQMHKYSTYTLPIAVMELFVTNDTIHAHDTRHAHDLRHQIGKREYMYKNFSFRAVHIWNHLKSRDNLKTAVSYTVFKHTLKEYLFHNNIIFRIT